MLAALAALAALARPDAAETRLVIPDELYLEFSLAPQPEAECPEDDPLDPQERQAAQARLAAPVRVAYADPVDLTAHLERVEDGLLRVLGRRVDVSSATIAGAGRDDLLVGALVRVVGTGNADGTVRAERVEILPPPDPSAAARLNREVEKFKRKFWKKARRLDDPELTGYVTGIVRRLVPEHVPPGDRRIEVHVVLDPDLNAFALPDGTIVVHTGLIARMDNEAQLATVLAHELAHITQRHADRAMKKDTEATLLGWGSLLASVLLGVSGNAPAAQGVELMSSALLSGWSRSQEDEADVVGLRYLHLAGYDVRQAPEVWKTFQILYGDPTREANFFYGSHSTGRDREHNLAREIWKSYEPSGLVGGRTGRDVYLARTAGALAENALLDLARGNLAWAEWAVAKGLAIAPENPRTWVAHGRIALRRGDGEALGDAIASFERAVNLDASCAEAWRELGFARLRAGLREAGAAALRRYLELAPAAPDADAVRRALART